MTKLSYSEKLQDPRWQKCRLSILSRDSFTCQLCKDDQSTLHVHHKSYEKGKSPWEYADENFVTYCKMCHKIVEGLKPITPVLVISKKVNETFITLVLLFSVNTKKDPFVVIVDYIIESEEFIVSKVLEKSFLKICLDSIETYTIKNNTH